MPLLVLQITSPTQEIRINGGLPDINSVKLQEYYAEGLSNQNPLYFQIKNQSTRSVYGNPPGVNYFPLIFPNFPNSSVVLNKRIQICGRENVWRDCPLLQMTVVDAQGNPAVFAKITLVFKINNFQKQTPMTMTNLEKSLRQN